MMMRLQHSRVLGVRLESVDYEGAVGKLEELAGGKKPAAVAACNTHLVGVAITDEVC